MWHGVPFARQWRPVVGSIDPPPPRWLKALLPQHGVSHLLRHTAAATHETYGFWSLLFILFPRAELVR